MTMCAQCHTKEASADYGLCGACHCERATRERWRKIREAEALARGAYKPEDEGPAMTSSDCMLMAAHGQSAAPLVHQQFAKSLADAGIDIGPRELQIVGPYELVATEFEMSEENILFLPGAEVQAILETVGSIRKMFLDAVLRLRNNKNK